MRRQDRRGWLGRRTRIQRDLYAGVRCAVAAGGLVGRGFGGRKRRAAKGLESQSFPRTLRLAWLVGPAATGLCGWRWCGRRVREGS